MTSALDLALRALLGAVPGFAVAFFALMAYAWGRVLAGDIRPRSRKPELVGTLGAVLAAGVFALGLGTHTEGSGDRTEVIRDWRPTKRHYAVAFGEALGFLLPCVLLGIGEGRQIRGEARRTEHMWQGLLRTSSRVKKKRE